MGFLTLTHSYIWTVISYVSLSSSGPGSIVGRATGYGLDGQGIEFRWGRGFPHLSRPALGPTQPPVQWVKGGQGVTTTSHPRLVPWSRKSKVIPLLPVWAIRPVQSLSACTRVHFTFSLFFLCHVRYRLFPLFWRIGKQI